MATSSAHPSGSVPAYPISWQRFSPEVRVLLACCGRHVDPGRLSSLVRDDLDWENLLQVGGRGVHQMLPTVYTHLLACCPGRIPAGIAKTLKEIHRHNAVFNLRLMTETLRLLQLLAGAGIPALPFKGPVMIASVYGDLGARHASTDTDLLVRPSDFQEAAKVLAEDGYRTTDPGEVRSAARLRELGAAGVHLVSQEHGLVVDLHWSLFQPSYDLSSDFEQLWEASEPRIIAGQSIRTLSPQDRIILLGVHSTKHLWERLKWLCDFRVCFEKDDHHDWDAILGRAARMRADHFLVVGLSVMDRLLGDGLSGRLGELVRERRRACAAAGKLVGILTLEGAPSARWHASLRRLRGKWALFASSSQRFRYLLTRLRPG